MKKDSICTKKMIEEKKAQLEHFIFNVGKTFALVNLEYEKEHNYYTEREYQELRNFVIDYID